jgi:HPt (histidine-containing phosphotransfer) domain-containing protein
MDSHTISPDPRLLDVQQLETFIMLGYEDYADLLGDVAHDVPGYFSTIRSAILAGDRAAGAAAAHSCRGMLSYFGCVALTERLAEIEHAPPIHEASAEPLYGELALLWEATQAALHEWERGVPNFAPGS